MPSSEFLPQEQIEDFPQSQEPVGVEYLDMTEVAELMMSKYPTLLAIAQARVVGACVDEYDAVQDAAERLLWAAKGQRIQNHPYAIRYVKKTVGNTALDAYRREKPHIRNHSIENDSENGREYENQGVSEADYICGSDIVERAIKFLTKKCADGIADAFYSTIVLGETYAAYAERTGTPLGTVKSRVRYAKKALYEAYAVGGSLPSPIVSNH